VSILNEEVYNPWPAAEQWADAYLARAFQQAEPEEGYAVGLQTVGGTVKKVQVRYKADGIGSSSIRFHGLIGSRQQETVDRLNVALNGEWPRGEIIFYVTPTDVEITSQLDMAYLAALVAKGPTFRLFCGEIDSDGRFLPLEAPLAVGKAAKDMGKTIVVPQASAGLVALTGANTIGVSNVEDLLLAIDGGLDFIEASSYEAVAKLEYSNADDLAVIKGQQEAKVALEIAVAGGHNLLFVGAPGEGKSALAKRAYTIMPQLDLEEAIEVSTLWHASGRVGTDELLTVPPFVAATKNTSPTALRGGGGLDGPQPGLVTLAHKGILFADEVFEWTRPRIDSLRIPLQDKEVIISRKDWQVTFPADFQLIASANPCPCGYWRHPERKCQCHENKSGYSTTRVRYVQKMSGPIMDRIDLKCWVPPLLDAAFDEPDGEPSSVIRQRVIAAREMQQQRYAQVDITRNAELGPGLFEMFCNESPKVMKVLKKVRSKLALSTRGLDKLRAVARTCADLRQSGTVEEEDVERAVQFMNVELPTR